MNTYLKNLFRPWKVITFVMGTALFVWGAFFFALPTWDVGVSFLMSILCYLLGPYAFLLGLGAIRGGDRRLLRGLAAVAIVYFVASGSYEIYNTIRMGMHPVTYWENLFYSVPTTIGAGMIWSYDGSLAELVTELRDTVNRR